ncbi:MULTISPECIES: RagB/SusD family nutrient uptake outer membrane protein [Sphingobacterium]|uniref:RagB/SusD family nutrient uptake outer membrane protein n=1 Tax=Sphingobacterium TaxID=28453 RepID=UPI0013DD32AF|nr:MULTISPECIES: RagB/SusD family nutrient uptake outer membrane protein [unclassified Sphingobacterium]
MKIILILPLLLLVAVMLSCDKFLDERSSNSVGIPTGVSDLRRLLDNEFDVNQFYPAQLEASTDNYFLNEQGYAGLQDIHQSVYTWEDQGMNQMNWTRPYRAITVANVVIETLNRMEGGSAEQRKELEGEALFLRGTALFYLAQVYCNHYSLLNSVEGLGLVLRLDSEVDIKLGRASLHDTYSRILDDLTKALELLPNSTPYITRSSKPVAAAMLSRIYLVTELFDKAEAMADIALGYNDNLLDFNSLDLSARYPFSLSNNVEIMYLGVSAAAAYNTAISTAFIPDDLYEQYEEKDLRKQAYFRTSGAGRRFKGFYNGVTSGYFAGVAVDELYLIKAECMARRNSLDEGAEYLNTLLRHRYEAGKYTDRVFADSKELLDNVLIERRKELLYRGLRWMDLRRLNIYPEYAITLSRVVKEGNVSSVYTLKPGDLKYTFLIPWIAVSSSGYQQNPR